MGRFVVTGVGVVSAAGLGLAALTEAVRRGRSFTRLLRPDEPWLGAPVCDFDPEVLLGRREVRRLDRGGAALLRGRSLRPQGRWARPRRETRVRYALVHSAGFGGRNAALVLGPWG